MKSRVFTDEQWQVLRRLRIKSAEVQHRAATVKKGVRVATLSLNGNTHHLTAAVDAACNARVTTKGSQILHQRRFVEPGMPQPIDASLASQSACGHERAGSEFWARNARRSDTASTICALRRAGKPVTAAELLRQR